MEEILELKEKLKGVEFMESAQQLMQNIISFNKPWDMERCLTPYPLLLGKWNLSANGDDEWCFMLNRFDYINDLILATIKSGDVSYANKWKEIVFDWIKHHNIIKKEASTRTLDTAIRCLNFSYGLTYLKKINEINEEEFAIVVNSIFDQMKYMKAEYIEKYTLSNWGSIQTTSMLICLSMLDEQFQEHELFEWAMKEVEIQFTIQVLNDGMCWEQSTMYHVEVLKLGLLLYYHSIKKHFQLFANLKEILYKMSDSLRMQRTPEGKIEAFGDSDRVGVDDILSVAAIVLNDGSFKFQESFTDDETYHYGSDVANAFEALKAVSHPQTLYFGRDSGMMTLRSDFGDKSDFFMISNGALGSGHGHSDNLHFSLYYQGKPFFIDKGRYSYREDCELRPYLKSMAAHNCIVVDDDPISQPKGSWDYERFCTPLKNYCVQEGDVAYFECAIHGECGEQDYLHIRKYFVFQQSIWVIFDEIKMKGEHHAVSYYHLDPNVEVKKTNDHDVVLKNENELKVQFDHNQKISIKISQCSLNYNDISQQKVIETSKMFRNQLMNYVIIVKNENRIQILDAHLRQAQSNEFVSEEIATAKEIIISKDESYLIVVFHQETIVGRKLYYVNEIPIYGKSIVIHILRGKTTILNLRA